MHAQTLGEAVETDPRSQTGNCFREGWQRSVGQCLVQSDHEADQNNRHPLRSMVQLEEYEKDKDKEKWMRHLVQKIGIFWDWLWV